MHSPIMNDTIDKDPQLLSMCIHVHAYSGTHQKPTIYPSTPAFARLPSIHPPSDPSVHPSVFMHVHLSSPSHSLPFASSPPPTPPPPPFGRGGQCGGHVGERAYMCGIIYIYIYIYDTYTHLPSAGAGSAAGTRGDVHPHLHQRPQVCGLPYIIYIYMRPTCSPL
jgi:hypothetical protein